MKLLHRILIYANLFLVTVAAQGMNTSETQSISCTSITSSPKRTQAVSIMPATLQMPPDKNSTAYAELVNQQRLMPSTPELNKKSQLLKRSKSFSSASLSISTLQPLQTQEQIPTLNVDHVASLQATITKQEDKINWLEKALNVYMAPQKPETISLETMSAESTKKQLAEQQEQIKKDGELIQKLYAKLRIIDAQEHAEREARLKEIETLHHENAEYKEAKAKHDKTMQEISSMSSSPSKNSVGFVLSKNPDKSAFELKFSK